MDMNDILAQWDQQQKESRVKKSVQQVSHKKANAPAAEDKIEKPAVNAINPMELWLRRYGTTDKDKLAEQSEEAGRMEDRAYLKNLRPEARIDLHGLTRDEAWLRLESFVADCVRKGFRKIEIVHGKGIHSHGSDPVLGQMVRTFIEQNKHLGTSGHNDKNHGGSGATWVLLK